MQKIRVMRFYITARTAKSEEVKKMYLLLKERGHTISLDWTQIFERKIIERPYSKNPETTGKYAGKVIRAIKNSDIFVMISDEEGRDMYGELASALSFNLIYRKPEIFVLGDKSSSSIFPFHSSIAHRNTLEEVLNEIEKGRI